MARDDEKTLRIVSALFWCVGGVAAAMVALWLLDLALGLPRQLEGPLGVALTLVALFVALRPLVVRRRP